MRWKEEALSFCVHKGNVWLQIHNYGHKNKTPSICRTPTWLKEVTSLDVKNHVSQRSLSLANTPYFRHCKFFLHVFPFKVKSSCDHNVIIIKVSVVPLERMQGMDVKYLGLSWILGILYLVLDEKFNYASF